MTISVSLLTTSHTFLNNLGIGDFSRCQGREKNVLKNDYFCWRLLASAYGLSSTGVAGGRNQICNFILIISNLTDANLNPWGALKAELVV